MGEIEHISVEHVCDFRHGIDLVGFLNFRDGLVARRGGDEFAVLVPDTGHHVDIERIVHRLLAALAQPIDLAGTNVSVSASVGIALAPDHGNDLERLLQLADLAMYEAKLRGKNRYAFAAEAGGHLTPTAPRAAAAS